MSSDPEPDAPFSPMLPEPPAPAGAETGFEPCFRRDFRKARKLGRVPLRAKKAIRRRLERRISCSLCNRDVLPETDGPGLSLDGEGEPFVVEPPRYFHTVPGEGEVECPCGETAHELAATYRDDYDWAKYPEAAEALRQRR